MGRHFGDARALRFGVFEVDLAAGELRKKGLKVRLQDQPFQVLVRLLESAGELVTREDLRERVWSGDTFVDFDHSLNNCINKLREALNDSATQPRYIETVPRRGYRFIAPVEIPGPEGASVEAAPAKEEPIDEPVSGRSWSRWHAFVLLGAIVVLASAFAVWSPSGRGLRSSIEEPAAIRSLAVLPLENLSGDPAQAYLADSVTDQLITDLAGIRALRVTSRTSVMRFQGTRKPTAEIGRDLNVEALVAGSVTRSNQSVRINVQVIHVASDEHLWARTYEGNWGEIFRLQREVALDIARHIPGQSRSQEQARISRSSTTNLKAQEAYFQGRYYSNMKKNSEGLNKAVLFFETAVANDPMYAQAYSGLANTLALLGSRGFLPPHVAFPRAKAEARKALALDDHLAEAHAAPGSAALYYDWEWATAEREFRRAIELNPSYANAYHWYSHYLIAMGRFEESLAASKKYMELDPLDIGTLVHLGEHYHYAQQEDEAIAQLRPAIEMDASRYRAHDNLGRAYEQKGMYEQALAEFERAVATSQEVGVTEASRAAGLAAAGRRNEALRLAKLLLSRSDGKYVSAYGMAEIFAVLGDKDQAFAWLDKAYEERSSALVYMKAEPRLRLLRSDARFEKLVRRVGL